VYSLYKSGATTMIDYLIFCCDVFPISNFKILAKAEKKKLPTTISCMETNQSGEN
jgi:hypothetical protein